MRVKQVPMSRLVKLQVLLNIPKPDIMKPIKLIPILAILALASVMPAFASYNMRIKMKDGSCHLVNLDDKPRLTIDSGCVNIEYLNSSISFEMQSIYRINYAMAGGVAFPETTDNGIEYDGNSILVNGGENGMTVSISSLNGIVIKNAVVDPFEHEKIPISALTPGIYIVSANGASIKISKQ